MTVVSNFLFWIGVLLVVGNYIGVAVTSKRQRSTGISATFRYDNIAFTALVLLTAAVARYLGW